MPAAKDTHALQRPVQFLKGAGPRRAELLGKLGIALVGDLLDHLPRTHADRSRIVSLAELPTSETGSCVVEVVHVSIQPVRRGGQILHAMLSDPSGVMPAVWFNPRYIRNLVKPGTRLMINGKVGDYRGRLQLVNPEIEPATDDEPAGLHIGRIVPVYPSTAGLTQRLLRSLVKQALEAAEGAIEETLPEALRRERALIGRFEAYEEIHFPRSKDTLAQAQRRISYEELLILQILLAARRRMRQARPAIAFTAKGDLSRRVARALPFELTAGQKRALLEIQHDLRAGTPMQRMLMGEVGSGKTVVALLAGCLVVEDGYQVAMLAPTELLAEQHASAVRRFLGGELVEVHLHTGATKAAARREILSAAAGGRAGFFIGTHALIHETVRFGRLGLVVIDEQHRFGVRQRAALAGKAIDEGAPDPDVLVMSATPIPRTLFLAQYADLDLSTIRELPAGRGRVVTRLVRERERERVYAFVRSELEARRRAYVVCPLIEESEASDLEAAEAMWTRLSRHPAFEGFEIGLVHGRMGSDEKAGVMARFRTGAIHVLVSTTVVEVGVDVPEASVMIVEHPERYGLSQLHQLRGRVGRGADRSVLVLMARGGLSTDAYERLAVLTRTSSGFEIAEKDLAFRGPGEVLGTRQHGALVLGLVDGPKREQLVRVARDDARALLAADPDLRGSPASRALSALILSRVGEEDAAFLRVG